MTAKIVDFRSRAELNMRAPKSVSYDIQPKNGGSAAHHGGSEPNPAPTDHAKCESTWRGWQNYHMDSQGWADIAYTAGYCNHGYVLAGRGYNVRTAANGTNDANDRFYAFCWIGGGNASVSQAAKDALEWLIGDARAHGGAGMEAKPHSSFYSTSCPGSTLSSFVKQFDGKNTSGGGSTPAPKPPTTSAPKFPLPSGHYFGPKSGPAESHSGYYNNDDDKFRPWQQQMKNRGWTITVDGYYGPQTEDVCRAFQDEKNLAVDGLIGAQTWGAAWTSPVT